MMQKTARFQGHWQPTGEVQNCRILANRAIIGRILHTNRKGWIYGFFKKRKWNFGENRSPYRVYFTRFELWMGWMFVLVVKPLYGKNPDETKGSSQQWLSAPYFIPH